MEFQNTSSGRLTRLSDTAQPGAVAAPVTSAAGFAHPVVEIECGRRSEQVHDVDGALWEVRETRATKHGFDLLFGQVANSQLAGRLRQGRPKLIATQALIDYWQARRTDTAAPYNLPASRWTLQDLRRQHGFSFFTDRRDLWKTRLADLKSMTMCEFANRYNVDRTTAQHWRRRLVGQSVRSPHWWKAPAVMEILRGPLSNREVAAKFNLSTHQTSYLRRRAITPDLPSRRSDKDHLLPKRWRTSQVVQTLRSGLSNSEVGKKLGISPTYAHRLRKFLANEVRLAE